MELEEINIQHCLAGRPESPALETTARLAVEGAMRELVTNKLLYQKVEVDLGGLPAALKKAGVEITAEKLAELQREVSLRPWKLETRHFGDDPRTAEILRFASVGCQPLETEQGNRNLHFYVPSVPLWCRVCKRETTFIGIVGSSEQGLGHQYPRRSDRGTEQVYTITYRCEVCRSVLHAVLVRREGMRLHLCGFAPRREQRAARSVPKALEPILMDADNAVAEGDLFAGYYHLRTMLEHHIKGSLGINPDVQMRGEDLVAQYNAMLPNGLKEMLPSLKTAYEKLSQALHSRAGSYEDYTAHQTSICDHLEGVSLLKKYQIA
jgi:hypothetical protein